MILEVVKSPGLAHLSYVLVDEDAQVCAVIDPRRDVDVYLDIARRHGARITHVLETHVHEDFVSGSCELFEKTSALVYAGRSEARGFSHRPVADGDAIRVGSLTLKAVATPGHTPEHMCYVVSGGKAAAAPWGVFTGDALFSGEVGRTDLLGKDQAEHWSGALYQSLVRRLLPLGDELSIFPAHGKGSPCGGNIGDRETSTIGYERRHNPKLQASDENGFVRQELESLEAAPFYYPRLKDINTLGPPVLGAVPEVLPLPPDVFAQRARDPDAVVLDTREIAAFGGGHIEGALNIGLREEFPLWAGWMLRPGQRLLLVVEHEDEVERAVRHLMRIGIDTIDGFLAPGMRGWFEAGLPFERLGELSVHELKSRLDLGDDLQVVDVRSDGEWEAGRIPGARHVYVPFLPERAGELDASRPAATYCTTGYRAGIAASVLRRAGLREVFNIPGSMTAWKAAGYPVEPVGPD